MIVIPCYNEADRLDRPAFRALGDGGQVHLLFVNDGSTDLTAEALGALAMSCPMIQVTDLSRNQGKGEAVRRGLRQAISTGASIVGYLDADLATPPEEMLRLVSVLEHRHDLDVALGSRVARLGSTIERSALRHYLGRVFASAASVALHCRVYDTQCGAKAFRVTPALQAALERPFRSPWAFDVELLGRLLHGNRTVPPVPAEAMLEMPLDTWQEPGGSRLGLAAMVRAVCDVGWMIVKRQGRRSGA